MKVQDAFTYQQKLVGKCYSIETTYNSSTWFQKEAYESKGVSMGGGGTMKSHKKNGYNNYISLKTTTVMLKRPLRGTGGAGTLDWNGRKQKFN